MGSLAAELQYHLYRCRLPARIRPTMCAFGGLADGFLPFPLPGGGTSVLGLASVVMKAAQARVVGGGSPQAAAASGGRMESAGKLGDDVSMSKAQVAALLSKAACRALVFYAPFCVQCG